VSMYYGPELVRILQAERIREAQEENRLTCCLEVEQAGADRSLANQFRDLFRRQSAATRTCSC
jgi:hypothetical protein